MLAAKPNENESFLNEFNRHFTEAMKANIHTENKWTELNAKPIARRKKHWTLADRRKQDARIEGEIRDTRKNNKKSNDSDYD